MGRGAAPELGLVVINLGADDGVRRGMRFTLCRGQSRVATVVIETLKRDWAAGRVHDKRSDPQVGDRAVVWRCGRCDGRRSRNIDEIIEALRVKLQKR